MGRGREKKEKKGVRDVREGGKNGKRGAGACMTSSSHVRGRWRWRLERGFRVEATKGAKGAKGAKGTDGKARKRV
eukprot:332455-Chlamydomonas_euryale.AAC.1